jgi:serine protease Do
MLDGEIDGSTGVGFAVPINNVTALLSRLRNGDIKRGQLGVELLAGPILEDEATELRLPNAAGAIVTIVNDDSAAARAGLQAGDVIVEVEGKPVTDTRDLIARVSSITPGTRVAVKVLRDGKEQLRTVTIEEVPLGNGHEPAGDAAEDDGLTFDESTSPVRNRRSSAGIDGALIVAVVPDSPADEADLTAGDIIRSINRRAVHTAAEAKRELRRIEPGRPIFLLVWRSGTSVFLQMRRD